MAKHMLPSLFVRCVPRAEVLTGAQPDGIFAADLWDMVRKRAYRDYQDAQRIFQGTCGDWVGGVVLRTD